MSIWCQQVVQTKMMWKRHQHGNVKGQTLLVWAKWLVLCAFHSENWFNPIMRLWVPNFHPSPFSNYCCIGLNMFLLFARITVITFLLVGKQLMTVNEHVKHIQAPHTSIYANNNSKNNILNSIDIGWSAKQQKIIIQLNASGSLGHPGTSPSPELCLFVCQHGLDNVRMVVLRTVDGRLAKHTSARRQCELWSELPPK